MADNSGGFFGGLSSGISEGQSNLLAQQQQQLAEQKQKALEANQTKTQAIEQVNSTLTHINDVIKATAAAGQDPKSIKAAIDPLVQSAQGLAKAAGMDPNHVALTVGAMMARPAEADDEAHQLITVKGSLGDPDRILRLEKKSGKVQAIDPDTGLPKGVAPAPGGGNLTGTPTNPTTITGVDVQDATPRPQQTAALTNPSTATDANPPITNPIAKKLVKNGVIEQATLDFQAEQYLLGNEKVVQGYRGNNGSAIRQAIQNRAAELAISRGMVPGDVNAAAASTSAARSTLATLTKTKNSIEQFENTAIANMDKLEEIANRVDKSGVPVAERWLRAGRQAAGDPEVAAFMTQMTLTRAEVAKILTNPNMNGVLTDEARKEIASALPDSASYKQIVAVNKLLKGDFGRRSTAIDNQIDSVLKSFKGSFKGSGGAAPADTPTTPTQPPVDQQRLKEKYGLK